MSWPHALRTMMLLGPPGTGKTTRLVTEFGRLLALGVPPNEIATVSHTRTSAYELRDRISAAHKLRDEDLVHSRTMHSAAFRGLGLSSDAVFGDDARKDWADRYGYVLTVRSDDDEPQTEDDRIFSIANRARHQMVAIESLPGVSAYHRAEALRLADRLSAYLDEHDLIDFTGMLERALDEELRVPVRAALIDEAQDLTPLAVAVAATMFARAEVIVIAGDDDQALYAFSGATPRWIIDLAAAVPRVETLRQSYRVPRRIHSAAMSVIDEASARVPKAYLPRDADGDIATVDRLDPALDAIRDTDSTMVLARTWHSLRPVVAGLRARSIPFVAPARPWLSPWRADQIGAMRVALRMSERTPISAGELRSLLELIASGRASPLPHGTKKRAAEHRGELGADEIEAWGLGRLRDQIRNRGPGSVMTRLPGRAREFLDDLARAGRIDYPSVALRSIHDAKGLEADHVILLSDWGRQPFDALHDPMLADDERRAAYVAVTRARERLTLVDAARRSYPWPAAATKGRE